MSTHPVSIQPRTILFLFVGAHVVNDFYVTVLPAFLPAIADEFDLEYTELGILSLSFTLLTGVLQPVFGNSADRLGRRRWMLVFGFAAGAVGFLAMAASPSFWFIVVASLLCGLGGATYHPQANAFVISAYPANRGRMLGIHGWGGSAGHFLAPAAVVLAVSVLDWRVVIAAIAVPLAVSALVLRLTLDETRPQPSATLRSALSPQLLMVAVSFGLVVMVGRSFLTFFVKMLVDEGWEETSAGVLLTVVLLGGAVAQPLGGWAFDRIGGRTVLAIAAGSLAAMVLLFAASSGALSLVAVAGIAFFHFSLLPVMLATASQQLPPERTGAATGVVFGVISLMTAAAQPAVGALAEAVGDIRVALSWLFPLALLGMVLALRSLSETAQDQRRPPSTVHG